MYIEDGWRFLSADFSIQAAGRYEHTKGIVRFVRSPEEKNRWFKLPEEIMESEDLPELYVTGEGVTLEDAFDDANLKARLAKKIIL